VYGVKRFKKLQWEGESVGLNKFKREVGLQINIHAHDFKASPVVSNRNAPGAAK
jgi:hypothetical protein